MKIKDFTVGQVAYAFYYEDIALLKGLKPKKYTVVKIGRKYLYAVRGEEVNIKAVPDYLLIRFKEPDYTDSFWKKILIMEIGQYYFQIWKQQKTITKKENL